MTLKKVKAIIVDIMGVDESEIGENTDFVNDLGADSLDIVQMLIAMEKEFGIAFNDKEMASIKTVNDAVTYIDTRKA